MYKSVLVYLLSLFTTFCFSQPLNAWPEADGWWTLQYYDDLGNPTGQLTRYHLDGDTTLQGQVYQKIHYPPPAGPGGGYFAATREDSSGRVWIMYRDSTSARLLYDFGALVGDTIFDVVSSHLGYPIFRDTVVILSKDTFQLNDGPHLRLVAQPIRPNSISLEWIDGMGNFGNSFYPIYDALVSGHDRLECHSREGASVYGVGLCLTSVDEGLEADLFSVYPNPASEVIRLQLDDPLLEASGTLSDMTGKMVRNYPVVPASLDVEALPPGLYFFTLKTELGTQTEKIMVQSIR